MPGPIPVQEFPDLSNGQRMVPTTRTSVVFWPNRFTFEVPDDDCQDQYHVLARAKLLLRGQLEAMFGTPVPLEHLDYKTWHVSRTGEETIFFGMAAGKVTY